MGLTDLFAGVLSMGWTALPVMGVVLAARLALRRAPRRYAYLLWAVVAFRLVCPVTIDSPVGLIAPERAQRQAEAVREAVAEIPVQTAVPDPVSQPVMPENPAPGPGTSSPADATQRRTADPMAVLAGVWLAGMCAMAAYILWSFLRLRRLVRTAVRREGNVWECDGLPTPFVLGLVRPRIYIPFRMEDMERTYVLAHEREHLRWRDHWVKMLALGILTVYWYHPGVWLCWILLCRDMELRCDEAVLASLGDGIKKDYSRSLVSFALDRGFPAALAFGEHDAVRRVKHVLAWKKAKGPVIFLALAAVVLVTAVCGTNAVDRSGSWIRNADWRRFPEGNGKNTYQIGEAYRSFLLYQERYDRGALTERTVWMSGTWGDDPGCFPYRGSLALDGSVKEKAIPGEQRSEFQEFHWSVVLGESGSAAETLYAAQDGPFTGSSWYARSGGREKIPLGTDTALAIAGLSRQADGAVADFDLPEGTAAPSEQSLKNDVVLVLRLRLSEKDEAALLAEFEAEAPALESREAREGDALARRLYSAARTPEAILEILGAEETLGRWTLEDAPHGYLSMLFYDCPQPLPDRDTAMWKYSMILLALLEDYDETTWNWVDNGERVRETNGGLWNTREWLNAHGLGKPIREYGESPEALRLLLGTLYPQYGGGAEISQTGIWLAALGGDLTAAMEALVRPVLGNVFGSFNFNGDNGILEITLQKPLSALHAADGGEGILSDLSCLLFALTTNETVWSIRWLDEGVPVEFSYLTSGDQFMENAAAIWTEHRSGEILDVRACGRGAAGMTLLAECLGVERFLDLDALQAAALDRTREERITQTASQLYEDSAEDAPDLLIDDLVCWAMWGDRALSGKYRQTMEQGTLLLEFPTDGGDGDRMDQRMARNAAILMRLRPEITAVRWTFPYGDGTAERTFDTGALSAVLPLSSNSVVFHQPQSASDVQALLRFLSGLNDRVFTAALEGRDIPRQTPFTDVLGYDGFLWDLQEGVFFSRTWYAVEEGREPFPIAETYGYDPPEAWELDLDGDGQKELVCNYVTGGDGHPGVSVYQRREDGVYQGHLSTQDLPGHNDWGLNSTWERYDPDTERFVISYDAGDSEKEALFTWAEALERMEWYSYSTS